MSTEYQLEQIKDNLASHQGEGVLVIVRDWEQCGWDMPESETPYGYDEKIYLGVATPPFLKQKPGFLADLTVCTPYYAIAKDWLRRDQINVEKGPISDWRLACHHLERPLGSKPGRKLHTWVGPVDDPDEFDRKEKLALEIIAGDSEITDWFVECARFGRMPKYQRELVENPEFTTHSSQRRYIESLKRSSLDLNLLIGYQRMRAALGLSSAVLPTDLDAMVVVRVKKIKEGIVKEIEKLIHQDNDYAARLAELANLQLPRLGMTLEGGGYEDIVRKDEDDLKMLRSVPLIKGQEGIQVKLRAQVLEAVGWGLDKEPWEIIREIRPGKQEITNVPVLIRGLAQYFEIPINKLS